MGGRVKVKTPKPTPAPAPAPAPTATPAAVSKNVSTNTGTPKTATTTTGTPKSTTTTGNNRQHTTNSNTQVVSTNTKPAPTVKVKEKSILSGLFGTPTVQNAPYAQTQNRQHLINSQSQISKSEQSVNKAQNQNYNFTYAKDASGNTYTITSQLSLQQRQDLAKQGIATSSIPYVITGFATSSVIGIGDIGFTYDANPNDIIVDSNLANADLEKDRDKEIQKNLKAGECYTPYTGGTICRQTADPQQDGFEQPQKPDVEYSAESSEVQLGANTFNSDGATTETADERYNDGSTLTKQKDDPLSVELLGDKALYTKEQWMSQFNQQTVPLPNYNAFSNNGKNGNNGIYSNGNGKANGNVFPNDSNWNYCINGYWIFKTKRCSSSTGSSIKGVSICVKYLVFQCILV